MSEFIPTDVEARAEELEAQSEDNLRATAQEEADLEWMMSDPRGRRIMWGLLGVTGVFRSSYTGDNGTFFKEGARNVGLIFMAKVNDICPVHYGEMLMEQRK